MPTLDGLIKEATEGYIENLHTSGQKKTPDEIVTELSKVTLDRIEVANAVRPKGHKFRTPNHLTPYQIAKMILETRHVICVKCVGDTGNPDSDIPAVYQETGDDAGIYATSDIALGRLIAEYNACITKKEIEETLLILKREAKHVPRTEDRDLIAVNNGIFDYKNKVLLPFSPDYVFLTKSRVAYIQNPGKPVIHNPTDNTDWDVESWLEEVAPDPEVRWLIWEILGAIIRPFVRWNKAVWFYSEQGNNGKGALCELMRNLCGPGSYASIPLSSFGKQFALEPLLRASAIIVDENSVGAYVDEAANLKAIITGDVIQIDRKFRDIIYFQFHGLVVQCLNEMPSVKDKSDSFYRRQLFLPFTKCFTGAERKYIKEDYLRRKEVLEYVLWKVLNLNYYELSEPESCKIALDEYKSFNDMVLQFMEEILPQCVWDLLPVEFLFCAYKAWMESNNPSGKPLGKKNFIKEVVRHLDHFPDWEYKDKPQTTGHLMDGPEPLILDLNLEDWKNPHYRGGPNLDKICTPNILKSGYRGLRRIGSRQTSSGSVGDEEKAS